MEQNININPNEIQNITINENTPQTIKLKNLSLEAIDINQTNSQDIDIKENKNQTIFIDDKGTPVIITDVMVNGVSVVINGIAYINVPTKTSDLTNDSGFISGYNLSKVAISGNYNDLNNKPTIPTKTSNLTNDSGFITANVDNLNNYTLTSDLSDVAITGSYDDLSNKPTIPTETSDLTNDSGFITNSVSDLVNYTLTSHLATVSITGDYDDLSNAPTIPTKTSDLTNDSGFITDSYHDNTKQDTLVSGTNIKTINNESILGSGNITVSGGASTDVQINGTSITSNNIANIITESSYNASTNKIATMSDIPNVPTKTSDLTNDSGFITSSSLPQDTGWQTITLTNSFTVYSSGYDVRVRKIGDIVYLSGVIKPTTNIADNQYTTMFTLPSNYRPTRELQFVCQGSGVNKWVLSILANGECKIQRYGTTSNIAIPTGTWLPFDVTFFVN